MEMTLPVLLWFVLGIVFFLLEMALPGFVIFFFGIGAWVTALAAWLYSSFGLNGQLALFLGSSLVSLFSLRGMIRRKYFGDTSQDEEADQLVRPGDTAEVIAAIIPPAEGKILYSGSSWRACADTEIAEGEKVTIVHQDGLLMHVKGM